MKKEAINKIELLLEEFDVQKFRRRVDRLADNKMQKSKEKDKTFRKKLPKVLRAPAKSIQRTRREMADTYLKFAARTRAEDKYNNSKNK
jgi:hypothetical protein